MTASWYPWHNAPPGQPYYGAPQQHPRVASFGRRLGARLIDYTLVGFFMFVLFILVSLIAEASLEGGRAIADPYFDAWATLFFFGAGPTMFLHDWLFNAARGRTPGKAMLGIRVVRRDGGPLRQGQAAGRAAVFGLPQTMPCLGQLFTLVECLSALSDARTALTLHDRAGGTMVVRG
ncbi:RDD family protein [Streptomonospora litoralis]|uniref:RDD family protein n=1 Tax=Streptomonospora litoralis TaxID=2498135 RepID=UPI001F61CC73|nr:RDD family protein [Streptomonospora litoralis]